MDGLRSRELATRGHVKQTGASEPEYSPCAHVGQDDAPSSGNTSSSSLLWSTVNPLMPKLVPNTFGTNMYILCFVSVIVAGSGQPKSASAYVKSTPSTVHF